VVIAQSAPQGSALGQGAAVDVLVSDGPRTEATFLPDLVGLDVEDARYLARVAGIPADRIMVDSVPSSAPAGSVVSQSLAPHRPIPRDEAVLRLIVGEGGAAASLQDVTPSFVGMTRADALAAIGTTPVDVEFAEALSLPEGVIDQDPDPGAPPADRIRLTVNAHPLPIPVPDATAVVREREPREVPFAWSIEPGIPTVTATVYATTLEGETTLVHSQMVAGGEAVEGSWRTRYPGVVTFRLELNGQPYSAPLRVP
jgi:beta-lactam-binding protein with PASTA domain